MDKNKHNIRIFIVGCAVSLFLFFLVIGAGSAVYRQKHRIKTIIRSISPASLNPFSHRKIDRETIPEEIDAQGRGIEINVNPVAELAKISPLIYGSNLATHMEYEMDIINFVKKTGITCFRFPGEDYGYHWETGKSDFNNRSANAPFHDINNVIEFCKKTDTKLILLVNIASGTPEEAAAWVRYMNDTAKFPVAYWEIGNEVFGDWDKAYMSASKYAKKITEYSRKMKEANPDIKIGVDWAPSSQDSFNVEVIKQAGEYIDFVSYHWYPNHINPSHRFEGRIHPTPKELMANSLQVPRIVGRMREIVSKYAPKEKGKIEFAFLEWDGAWDGPNSDFSPYSQGIAQWSLANAIFHADCLGQFAAAGVKVATEYYLQDINFGLIRGWDKNAGWGGQRWDGQTVRPKAYAIELFSRHFGDTLIESKVNNSPAYYKKSDWWPDSYAGYVPYISCYASKSSGGDKLFLVLINKHQDKDYRASVKLGSVKVNSFANIFLLNGPDILSENDGKPGQVRIKEYNAQNMSNSFGYTLPAHSVSVIEIELEDENVKT